MARRGAAIMIIIIIIIGLIRTNAASTIKYTIKQTTKHTKMIRKDISYRLN